VAGKVLIRLWSLNIRGVDSIPTKSAFDLGGTRTDQSLTIIVAPHRQILLYLSQGV
jgi:hypothetical protein